MKIEILMNCGPNLTMFIWEVKMWETLILEGLSDRKKGYDFKGLILT